MVLNKRIITDQKYKYNGFKNSHNSLYNEFDPFYSGFSGCENDITFLHYENVSVKSYRNDYFSAVELFSRARKKILIMMSKDELNTSDNNWFFASLKEMIVHGENKCENEYCRREGLNNKKVLITRIKDTTKHG